MEQKYKISQLNSFMVYRDGKPDKAWYREQRRARCREAAKQGTLVVVKTLARPFKNAAHNLSFAARIKFYDAVNGTQFYDQLLRERKAAADRAFARKIGLST